MPFVSLDAFIAVFFEPTTFASVGYLVLLRLEQRFTALRTKGKRMQDREQGASGEAKLLQNASPDRKGRHDGHR